jgi:putative ABC transport system permease protein
MYPEFRIPDAQFRTFMRDRKGTIVDRKLARTYGFSVDDVAPLKGAIFPGAWSFVVQFADVDRAAQVSEEIDALFKYSSAETLTETEKAF